MLLADLHSAQIWLVKSAIQQASNRKLVLVFLSSTNQWNKYVPNNDITTPEMIKLLLYFLYISSKSSMPSSSMVHKKVTSDSEEFPT